MPLYFFKFKFNEVWEDVNATGLYLRQYRVVPPEDAIHQSLGQRRGAAVGDAGLTHRAQGAVYPLEKRPEQARLSLHRRRHATL